MKKQFFLSVLSVSVLLASTSCTKSGTSDPAIDKTNDGTFKVFTEGKVTTVQNLIADTIIGVSAMGQPYGSGRFSFFSLENKVKVPNTDSATQNWDIALKGTTILTNGGTSGPGGGGAFVWVGAFDNLTSIPADSTFKTDNAPSYAITTGSGKGWYNYDGPTNLITALPGRVLVIRTAKGRYAKVEILNYYKKGLTPAATDPDDIKMKNQRYYLLRYTYQPDGSKIF
jgi:hypothetical protein